MLISKHRHNIDSETYLAMRTQKINHLAIWLLVVVQMMLAGLWYEVAVKEIWSTMTGIQPEDFNDFNPVNYAWPFLAALSLGYMMAWLLRELQVESVDRALKLASLFWLCFLFLEMAALNVMSLRLLALTFVDEGLTLIKYLLIAGVLTVWKKK